ncbi:hypothetical protein CPZ13_11270 [Lacticaseibacillus paracasei]|nr:hypothetical protein DMC16_09990 [Lacticaseibacillus paracasei]MBG1272663.1 hypothetical protein [Lacticaseibacillus paracasei subsp. paracasei]PTS45637.1 hypothetical protein DBQ69_09190 [Lactobacillus sp. DS1_6]PTS50103.1 hypothetical protein DBQ60_08880 [Lactobacillus sp. DS2_6]PTV39269.1 hypothetical protein DB344_09005 [Lactobacillus sp. DS13_6]
MLQKNPLKPSVDNEEIAADRLRFLFGFACAARINLRLTSLIDTRIMNLIAFRFGQAVRTIYCPF